jgi:hypothetical protein
MSDESTPSKDENTSRGTSNGINALLITGLLAIFGTVTGEVIKGYWSNTLADKDYHSKLILDALTSKDIDVRKQSLQFLVDTNLVTDSKLKEGILQSINQGNVPQFGLTKAEFDETMRDQKALADMEALTRKAMAEKLKAQTSSFVDDLRELSLDPTMTDEQKRQAYVKIVTDANLVGKLEPNENALRNFFQDPNTTAAQRDVLSTALSAALRH